MAGQLCRNPRVFKEARTLSEAGYEVTVVTLANIPRFEAFDRELLQHAKFRKVAVDHVPVTAPGHLRYFVDRAFTWVARKGAKYGLRSPHAFGPFRSLQSLNRQVPADLTIVHTELPFCIGARLLREGRRVAADFEDWHSQDLLPHAQKTRPRGLLVSVERQLLRHAAYTSTTSEAMASALESAYGGAKPVVIRNVFPSNAISRHQPTGHPVSLFWFSQTIGPGRGLEDFVSAWSQTKTDTRLCLLGDVSDEYRAALRARMPRDRESRLEFLPIVAPDRLPEIIAQHDIGLALEPSAPPNKDLTISNKIFQYLDAGLAVLATPTAGQQEVLSQTQGAGEFIDLGQPATVAAKIDELIADSSRLERMKQAARDAATAIFSWEKEAPRLLEAVRGALEGCHR